MVIVSAMEKTERYVFCDNAYCYLKNSANDSIYTHSIYMNEDNRIIMEMNDDEWEGDRYFWIDFDFNLM